MGITNQRETTLLWNKKTGKPLANAIVWQDMRVAADVAKMANEVGNDFFRRRTGLPLSTYFSALKLRWLLENIPGARRQAEAGVIMFGNVDAFLLWKLTGGSVHATDVTNASRTQLMDLQTLEWDAELLRAFGIPRQVLPEIRSSSEVYGPVRKGRSKAWRWQAFWATSRRRWWDKPVPQRRSQEYLWHRLLPVDEYRREAGGIETRAADDLAYKLGREPARYALEGSVAIGGALVQWLRDNLGMIKTSAEIEELAQSWKTTAAYTWSRRFPGCMRRIGRRMRAA